MTNADLLSLKDVIGSARFAYAAALVGAKCQDSKEALAHMRELARLEKVISKELENTHDQTT
mgnify:CR=1 FL=1